MWSRSFGTNVPATWSAVQRYKIMVHELGLVELEVSVDDQEKLLNLALNKVSGRWDEGALAWLLEELQESGADLSLSGFDDGEIEDLISSLPDVPEIDIPVVEDDFGVQQALDDIKEPETRRGVWQLGQHRLVCGDATDQEDVALLMDGAKAALVVTDPPYNVAVESDSERLAADGRSS
ncbi:hypothetical protein J14TS5_31750 [Paenibacillus lautus]|uniref:hypothetical protein n=1 Tax=Paenibacillus lautus TaxID=1401 RepID=UPI001B21BECB|nr:hypothetical protein [Paenibacillus lautus]GIO98089.1 hypothetical protein J14TS5_31750 [Paenibacillus lautus]